MTRSFLSGIFSEEHRRFGEEVREVASHWIAEVDQWEAEGHLPADLFRELGSGGFYARRWEAGHAPGLPYALMLAIEIGRLSGGAGLGLTLHNEIFTGLLKRLARTPSQRDLLADALAGEVIGCFGSTEGRGGSDIAGAATCARRVPGGWHLTGEKRYTSNAGTATHVVLLCRADELPPGRDSCLFVAPLGGGGVEVAGFYPKAGIHSCDAAQLVIDVELDEDSALGLPGTGLLYTNQVLQLERISLSAQLVAAGHGALGLVAAYARKRRIYDERLMSLTSVRQRLAEAQARLWAAEALLAAVVKAAMQGENVAHGTAAAKLCCARTTGFVIDECIQVMGGRGYTANYPLERLWRDVRLARIGAGADEVMRELVASSLDRPDAEFDAWVDELDARDVPQEDAVVRSWT